ncbi:solute carrier family 43 member 3b isoform X1 [Solea solea]|uniref:solute carrier family 43 member 3b isoform X1 n=1 Tax=Solea solea TaxID=90069 RepID=UPI00272D8209|nr:solute carrier family 43 member 3b isoform X1 [Solea solea]
MAGRVSGLAVRRYLTFFSGLFECLCFAGVIYGWASLVFVLKKDNYFGSLCVNTTGVNGTHELDCSGQDEKFSLVFTIASFMNNFMTLPNGFLFDYFGTTVARIFGISIYTTGSLMMAFSSSVPDLLFPALSLLATGGIMFLVTNMQVGNLFGVHRSTIITLYNGAFDSSSAVFFVIKMIHEIGISVRTSFLFLSACSIIHLVRTFLLLPRKLIPYPLPDNYTYGITCGKSSTQTSKVALNDEKPTMIEEISVKKVPTVETPVEKTFRQCILSWFFLWHLVWLSVMQFRHIMFIGTLNPMLNRMTEGEPSLVSSYLNAFAITQLCGVLCAPWNGFIIDRLKRRYQNRGLNEQEADLQATVLSLFITALQCMLFSICATIPFLPLQYFTFVLQVLNRSFLYGGNAAFISVAFPPRHFGKLFGVVMALSAVVLALQYPCFSLVRDVLDGDPLYLNIGLALFCLFAFIHPACVFRHCRRTAAAAAAASSQDMSIHS